LYWLGCQESKKPWQNPFTLGAVDASTTQNSGWYLLPSSGTGGRNDLAVLFERPSSNTWCSSTSDRLVVIDLIKYQVKVTEVTLGCQYEPHTYLVTFNVSGSNDKSSWDVLFSESSSKVSTGTPFTWTIPKDKSQKSYRYFKFESGNSSQILISGIELYGTVSKVKK